jgi:K+-transporting ATPase ATPase C chain
LSARTGPIRERRPAREPRELPADLSASIEVEGTGLAKDPPLRWPSARAVGTGLVLLILVTGVAYPWVFTEVTYAISPSTATGANLTLGQNITDPALFWERPSLIDYEPFSGAGGEVPYGPVDPALINETEAYIAEYGLENVTVPLNLVSPSESGLDPDITPEAALVQIPRVAHYSNLTESALLQLVNASIHQPTAGFIGPQYVNVISLDETLLALENRSVPTTSMTSLR